MKHTSPNAFTVFDGTVEPPVELSLAPDESIIGWYRNPPPWEHDVIVFTSKAIYLIDDERVDRIALSDVMDCEMPKSEEGVTGFRVITKDGFRFVRMAGRSGPHEDHTVAFSYIDIVARLNRENATKGG